MPQQQEVKASLGCGTLILIAVIVMIFGGNKNRDELEDRIDKILLEEQQNAEALEDKIDQLTEEVKTLREEVRTRQTPAERND